MGLNYNSQHFGFLHEKNVITNCLLDHFNGHSNLLERLTEQVKCGFLTAVLQSHLQFFFLEKKEIYLWKSSCKHDFH